MAFHLYDYQLDAIDKMKNGCILNGGVGTGKSRTSLGYFFKVNGFDVRDGNPTDFLHSDLLDLYIITTAKKRDSFEWECDMVPFSLSTKDDNYYNNHVLVDSWNNIEKYRDVKGAFFIFDEQRVCGYGTWAKTFIKIAKQNKWILLSATPGDCWLDYAPVFIANGFYKNMTDFKREHVVYKYYTNFPQIDRYLGVSRLNAYRRSLLVDMNMKRTTRAHDENIYVTYNPGAYRDITRNRWNVWKDKPIENASELCYAMRRVVNSDESRGVAVLEIFEKHPKLIIFYNFSYELELLKSLYYGPDVEIAEWNGKKHQHIPECDSWVYLVQYNACEGWSCTRTDTIVFYSQSYSYKTLEQAKGRINRLNTPYTDLYYYHLRSRSGIDLAITRALDRKEEFNAREFLGSNWKN